MRPWEDELSWSCFILKYSVGPTAQRSFNKQNTKDFYISKIKPTILFVFDCLLAFKFVFHLVFLCHVLVLDILQSLCNVKWFHVQSQAVMKGTVNLWYFNLYFDLELNTSTKLLNCFSLSRTWNLSLLLWCWFLGFVLQGYMAELHWLELEAGIVTERVLLCRMELQDPLKYYRKETMFSWSS